MAWGGIEFQTVITVCKSALGAVARPGILGKWQFTQDKGRL